MHLFAISFAARTIPERWDQIKQVLLNITNTFWFKTFNIAKVRMHSVLCSRLWHFLFEKVRKEMIFIVVKVPCSDKES